MTSDGAGIRWDAIQLDATDNVATVYRPLEAGVQANVAGASVAPPVLTDPIARGHKFALSPISAGETVYKYGAPIGIATVDIEAGRHVHLHNIEGFAGQDARRDAVQ
ncbi:MAG: UxaA family hydrolase [Pseudomonadota bacterium]